MVSKFQPNGLAVVDVATRTGGPLLQPGEQGQLELRAAAHFSIQRGGNSNSGYYFK